MKTRKMIKKNSERVLKRSGPLSEAFRQKSEALSVDRMVSEGVKKIFEAVKARRATENKMTLSA
jgi:hypothetical protein